ncbi:uncharacterized protein LOC123268453 [Cotesia glomerata]|uniref:Ribosome-binding factor A, mitochondrial n=1 Tax=Cotesia glomerata TaxID=32391 RepID=A0AAV7I994_COTGL|nr:uncharacterized protein LOC123268453 [Cotesia glomerata]XP_044589443.1 uncharacterized protein LOC123268453 [Cotesia glomerata]XP_044589444.1 uncharacterized protein LOC123268453 [Cotesia glomerata]KAH0546765.1 hypothetical protein KQX54_014849 [Cotesia glomerata]
MPLMCRNITRMSYCVHRYIHATAVNNKAFNYARREGKFMRKIVSNELPKRKWYPEKSEKIASSLPSSAQKLVSPHVTRRVKVLNKLFMKYITDIMTTGEVAADVVGLGIEITQVKISNDFQIVRVLWYSYNTGNLDQITDILNGTAYKLRHELSQLKIIGVVPPIKFVRDKQRTVMAQLEKVFENADYGEDYVRTVRTAPTPELSLFTKLSDEVREKILNIDSSYVNSYEENVGDEICYDEMYDVDLPPMRSDVLGLNQGIIMTQIKQSLNKSKDAIKNRLENVTTDIPEKVYTFNPSSIQTIRTEEEIQAFNDFLIKRRVEEKRSKKLNLDPYNEDDIDFHENTEEDQVDDNEYFNFDSFDDTSEKELH